MIHSQNKTVELKLTPEWYLLYLKNKLELEVKAFV